jgi:uncharacterized membrane protein YcaP (DUF421 family)
MDVALRSLFGFLLVLLVTRVVGRRELSSMEPFDLILLVVIGDLVQQGITQDDYSVTGALIVVSVIGLMTVLVAYLNFRVSWLRPLFEGGLVVLVEDGQVIQRNLKRERITIEELESEARLQQLESLDDVRLAVLETNGRISFIARSSSS